MTDQADKNGDRAYKIDIADLPEFENLVAEVEFGSGLVMIVSREPADDEMMIWFGNSSVPPVSYRAYPPEWHRLPWRVVNAAIDEATAALVSDHDRET